MGVYTAAGVALADGQHVEDQVDSAGRRLIVGASSTNTARLLSSAATTNGANVKASAGVLTQINGTSRAATDRFLKIYDKATGPTVGTDTPRMTFLLPPGQSFVFDCNDSFALGIGYAITGLAADADATAIAVGDILCMNVDYR